MIDTRRVGDNRPLKRDPSIRLKWAPSIHAPLRWLPRHGEPFCMVEWMSQKVISSLAFLPVYTAIIVTLVLLVQIFGVPLIGKR